MRREEAFKIVESRMWKVLAVVGSDVNIDWDYENRSTPVNRRTTPRRAIAITIRIAAAEPVVGNCGAGAKQLKAAA